MAKLIYSAITSLDGYVNDADGGFAWAAPDAEVHAFVNDLERPIGTYLYGRRMYEVMKVWETMPTAGEPVVVQDFAAKTLKLGVLMWQFAILTLVQRNPGASQLQLCAAIGLDKSSLTLVVQQLERRGLMDCMESPVEPDQPPPI